MKTAKVLNLNYMSLESVLENIDDLEFTTISINPEFEATYDFGKGRTEYTDLEHPIGIGKVGYSIDKTLCINKEYYLQNKEYVDSMLSKIGSKLKKYIGLNGIELINSNVVNSILENTSINEIRLYSSKEDEQYNLSSDMYEKIKNHPNITKVYTCGVEKELEENFDSIISYNERSLVLSNSYKRLQTTNTLYISDTIKLTEEELENFKYLKYLNKEASIEINAIDSDTLDKVITGLIKNNVPNKIKIKLNDKNRAYFNSTIASKLPNPSLVTINCNGEYPLEEYIGYEKRLDALIEPAKNLSPLERYLYAYNVVKKFKPYKEAENSKDESRNLYKILDNEYMVCVGYSTMLIDLLRRLGINAYELSVGVNTGYDDVLNDALEIGDNYAKKDGHARLQVKLEDPKYNIKGIYNVDPTWDNNMEDDLYMHTLMTSEEYNSLNRENFRNIYDHDEILESKTIEEFYNRVNYFLDFDRKRLIQEEKDFVEKSYKLIDDPNKDNIIDKINFILKTDYNLGNHNFYMGNLDRDKVVKEIAYYIVSDYKYKNLKENELDDFIKEKVKYNMQRLKSKNPYEAEDKMIQKLSDYIKKFNPTMYDDMRNKYPYLFNLYTSDRKEKYQEGFNKLVEEIALYTTSMNNNKVQGKTILEAVKEVYKTYGIENIDEKIEQTRKVNEELYSLTNPTRMKITDNEEEIYMNGENKFSEDVVVR